MNCECRQSLFLGHQMYDMGRVEQGYQIGPRVGQVQRELDYSGAEGEVKDCKESPHYSRDKLIESPTLGVKDWSGTYFLLVSHLHRNSIAIRYHHHHAFYKEFVRRQDGSSSLGSHSVGQKSWVSIMLFYKQSYPQADGTDVK